MAKLSSQERRKHVLKQRKAEQQQQWDRREADAVFREACQSHRAGDEPDAGRLLKKVLILDADHTGALDLLAQIHADAGHFSDALAYLRRRQKLKNDPGVVFNIGVVYHRRSEYDHAAQAMSEFLAATKPPAGRHWAPQRATAESICAFARNQTKLAHATLKPEPPASKPCDPAPPPAPETPPAPPRAGVRFLPPSAPPFAQTGTLAGYFLKRRLLALRLAQNFEDLVCLPSLQGVDPYIYQQETVRRVLRHFKGRALLADEVGLGKTIEACLVLKEYWMRGLVRKALVLTPPSLVSQWRGELLEKFGLPSAAPDAAELRRNPRFWQDEPLVVASLAMARLDAHAPAIAAVPWDIVIVDEAHCLKSRASANWRLVDSLQRKFILMLTATPVENNLLELYNLITLLKPGLLATEAEFRKTYVTAGNPRAPKNADQLRTMLGDVMIRNTRAAADVQLPRRIAASVPVKPSETERQVYEMTSRFVAERYRPAQGKRTPPIALDLLQRQAGSTPRALVRSLSHALEEGSWATKKDRRELEEILELASGIDAGSKGKQLGHMLAGHTGKSVVFTEFLPTLEHLRTVCNEHGIACAVFGGDLSRADKDAAIAHFRDHADVLLSTGAGGEGRNLQFADTVVNFDLPWNPMRLEQRVGRVHRIGQTRDVFVFNFYQEGTVEEQILRVLHDKINMFELVVGEMDAVLGTLEDSRDFAEIVMDLWISGRETGQVDAAFEELAVRLLEAKKRHVNVQELDESLFARDFEV
ncbi:MAG: SNF2-related protein [Bryobacteraceae bacterium]